MANRFLRLAGLRLTLAARPLTGPAYAQRPAALSRKLVMEGSDLRTTAYGGALHVLAAGHAW